MSKKNIANNTSKKAAHAINTSTTVQKSNIDQWGKVALGVILITSFIIYYKALKFNILYSWDDQLYIRDNVDIINLHWANIKSFFTKFYVGNYQPLSMLSYGLDYKMGGTHASLFYFNNILLHLCNTFLVFLLIRKISPQNYVVALITAAFFAVHPMHVESVAWISERKDVLYTFFFLLSLIFYINYLHSQKIKHLIFVVVFFVLSCLSKSAAVILPLLLLLFDNYTNRKFTRKTIAEKIPFFVISITFGIVALYSQKSAGAIDNMAPAMSIVERVSIVSYSFMSYLLKSVLPFQLSSFYPYPTEIGSTLPFQYYFSILVVAFLLAFVWYSRKWGKDIIFGSLFFISTLILVLQFFPVGAASMADRYTYIPFIGLFFIIGKTYERMLQKKANINFQKYSSILFVATFLIFSTISYSRVKIWENEDTLFSDVIKKYPECNLAYRGRGMFLLNHPSVNNKESDIKRALSDLENSLKFSRSPKDTVKAYYDLGVAQSTLGNPISAIDYYTKSIDMNTRHGKSYINRGSCYLDYVLKMVANDPIEKEKYLKKAIHDFESALTCELNIDDKAKAYCNLGDAKNRLGDFTGAINDLDKGIQMHSNIDYSVAYTSRGCANFFIKNYEAALEDFNKSIKLNPNDANTINNRNLVISILESTKK